MLRFTSYTDEFYIQEIHNGNKKVIDHFYAFCRDYYCKTYKKLFQEENQEADFFQEAFIKLWKERDIEFAIYGMENQTLPEKYMPLRILGYDGATYRSQLQKKSMFPKDIP